MLLTRLVAHFLVAGVLRVAMPAPAPVPLPMRLAEPFSVPVDEPVVVAHRRPRPIEALRFDQTPPDDNGPQAPNLDERVGNRVVSVFIPGWNGHAAVTFGGNIARDYSGVRLVGFKIAF
jgi:hypothetical protein